MTQPWSTRIANRYSCRLSTELADWFDSGTWNRSGVGEFRQSIPPDTLISPAPEAIWPGMMGSNCLPILHNTAGDWLCVRVDEQNNASQIIHWYHGGGDWIPWGNNLAEAIAFDAIADRFPSHSIRHAVPAESTRPSRSSESKTDDFFLRWALDHLPDSIATSINLGNHYNEIATAFLANHVAEVATLCELSISALVDRPGDWQSAATHAKPATEIAPELGWAWESIGIAAETHGDLEAAKKAYLRAATCSAFTDQTVRLATHLSAGQAAKSSVARLLSLDSAIVHASEYMRLLCLEDEPKRRAKVSGHWITKGRQLQQQNDLAAAYHAYVAAGWDIGATPMESYGTILEAVAETALAINQTARAEIALTHRKCLNVRFGV